MTLRLERRASRRRGRRPGTRIGRTVLLSGGAVIQLSRTNRVLFALGLRKYLSTPHHERRSL